MRLRSLLLVSGRTVGAADDVPAVGDLGVAGAIYFAFQPGPLQLTRLGGVLHLLWVDVIEPKVGDHFVFAHSVLQWVQDAMSLSRRCAEP